MDNFFTVGRVIDVESQSQAKPYPLEVAIGYVASLEVDLFQSSGATTRTFLLMQVTVGVHFVAAVL